MANENRTADVAAAIAQLQAHGVDLSGPCGAARIANLVAWNLRPGFVLLRKVGGFRATLHDDGCAPGGDGFDSREPGIATDYIIDRATGYGYDILSDSGGANTPHWIVETAADMVQRNLNPNNQQEPMDPAAYMERRQSPPPVVVDTPPPTPPVPPAPDTLALIFAQVVDNGKKLDELKANVATKNDLIELRQQAVDGAKAAAKSLPFLAKLFGG